jgi:hypothetical protein
MARCARAAERRCSNARIVIYIKVAVGMTHSEVPFYLQRNQNVRHVCAVCGSGRSLQASGGGEAHHLNSSLLENRSIFLSPGT